MKYRPLTDERWRYIEPLLPPAAGRGGQASPERMTDGPSTPSSTSCLKTGIPWNDLPKEYWDDSTANRRLRRWEKREGVWKRIMDALLSDGYSEGRLGIDDLSIDSERHHTGQKGGRLIGFDAHKKVNGTKIHAVVNEESAPIAVTIGKGSEHEGRKLIPLMKSISIRHGKGRPRKNPRRVYVDAKIKQMHEKTLQKTAYVGYCIKGSESHAAKRVDTGGTGDAEIQAILFVINELSKFNRVITVCDHESVVSEAKKKAVKRSSPLLKELRRMLQINPSIGLEAREPSPAHRIITEYVGQLEQDVAVG